MAKWTLIKKAEQDWKVVEKDSKYQIEGPDGSYKDEEGKIYEFDTKEKALEEIEYLKAEHKYEDKDNDKKEANLKKKADIETIAYKKKLIELMDKLIIDPRMVADACLDYMSDEDIKNMAIKEGLEI